MITIKCPKCATLLKVAASATAVRVKCPKCQTLLQVPASTPSTRLATPSARSQPKSQPTQPHPTKLKPTPNATRPTPPVQPIATAQATPPENASPGGFDCGELGDSGGAAPTSGALPGGSFDPSAVAPGGFAPLATPATIPTGPTAAPKPANIPAPKQTQPKKSKSASKKTYLVIALGDGGILAMLFCGGLVAWLVSSTGETVASVKPATAAVPAAEGYKSFATGRVSAALPRGEKLRDFPTGFQGIAVKSETTNSYFLVGSGTLRWSQPKEQDLANFASSQIMSTISLGDPCTRGERSGLKGRCFNGLIIPSSLEVEVYPRGDQFDIIAWGRRVAPRPVYDPRFPDKAPKPPPPPKATDDVVDTEIATFLESLRLS